ncbi:MAG: DUF5331 domain-containing protein [Sphaerospermopsis sp. SIO1G1]|nr:DUF5331 domain-containing protein [Sphaerospermopsis sp. SIO1G1]
MNIKQLRQTLKLKWLSYYQENISWLVKMQIWRSYDGVRRPLSSYILATLSTLEPQFQEILPFLLELNNNPDQIVAALGLNFNPDQELNLLELENSDAQHQMMNQPISHFDAIDNQDNYTVKETVSEVVKSRQKVLLKVVPNVKQQHRSVAVVAINKQVNPSVVKDKSEIERSPTITTPTPIKYQFTGLPVQEIAYISATTNARSLPAWMDEFCPGVNR